MQSSGLPCGVQLRRRRRGGCPAVVAGRPWWLAVADGCPAVLRAGPWWLLDRGDRHAVVRAAGRHAL